MRRRLFAVVSVALSLVTVEAARSHADEYQTREVTVTATRREQEIFDTPAPTAVITAEDIARRNPTDVGDLLEDAAGVDVADDGALRGRPVIRGLDSNRVLILVDGLRVSNPRVLTGFGGAQPTIDPQDIERIEVVRGPTSVLYGTDALGGVINIITRQPAFSPQWATAESLRFGYGTAGNRREALAGIDVGGPSLAASIRASGREADDYHSPSGRVPDSGARAGSVTPRLRYRFDTGWLAGLDGEVFRAADVGVPVEAESRDIFDGEFRRDDRDRGTLRLETPSITGGLFSHASVVSFYQRQKRNFTFTVNVEEDGGSPNDPNDDVDVFVFSDTTSTIETLGSNLLSEWKFPGWISGVSTHILSAGLDFFQDSISDESFRISDVFVGPGVVFDGTGVPNVDSPVPLPRGPGLADEHEESSDPSVPDAVQRSVATFLQDELLLPWETSLFLGGRADAIFFDADSRPGDDFKTSETTVALTGSAGVVVPILPWLNGVINVARGFRAPNLAERFFMGPGTTGGLIVPNPGLRPETSFNVDAGFKLAHSRVRGALTYFRSDVRELIRVVPTEEVETFTFQNIDDVVLQGLEAEAEVALTRSIALGGTIAFTDERASVIDEVADFPTAAPPLNGTVVIRYEPLRIRMPGYEIGAPYVESRARLVGDFEDLRGRRRDGYVTVALRSGFRMAHGSWGDARLDLGLENLFDEAYVPTFGSAEAPGRALGVSVSWRF